MMNVEHPRRIRSFVKRETRLTEAQARALQLLPDYSLAFDALLPFNDIILEIGFGKGESLFAQASSHPEQGFIGVEVHRPGMGQFLNRVHQAGLNNVRVCHQDVIEVLQRLPEVSLSGIQIFFPDPWPKSRHHKRRLIQPEFLHLIHRVLKPGAFVHCATDWEDYAIQMLSVFNTDKRFVNASTDGSGFIPRPNRLVSSFEARGLRLGHQVRDMYHLNCQHSAQQSAPLSPRK